MKLSYIIPVYNCEHCVGQCLDSILSVGGDYEIILINDGSSDRSIDVCNAYKNKFDCIRAFSQTNKGTSSARNVGLDNAEGDYIWFVDADDRIEQNIYKSIFSVLDFCPEMVCFNYRTISKNSESISYEWKVSGCYSGVEFLENMHTMYLWNKIYRRDIIGTTRFVDGTKNIEDMYFNLCVLSSVSKIVAIPEIGYSYICVSDSSTSRNISKRNLIKLSEDTLTIQHRILDDIARTSDVRHRRTLTLYMNLSQLGHIFSLIRFYNLNRIKRVIDIYKEWNVYPIGKTNNQKANAFSIVVNNVWLLKTFYYSYRSILGLIYSHSSYRKC